MIIITMIMIIRGLRVLPQRQAQDALGDGRQPGAQSYDSDMIHRSKLYQTML